MEETKWLDLLLYTDRLNRSVKEAGWNYADKEKVYSLKDSVVQTLLRAKPDGVNFELYYVPYFKYSSATKDRAGALMRQDGSKYPFEYYLSQVEPSEYDYEVPEKALVEVTVECLGQEFSFHMPLDKITECGYVISSLERKVWINSTDFHHSQLLKFEPHIKELLSHVSE